MEKENSDSKQVLGLVKDRLYLIIPAQDRLYPMIKPMSGNNVCVACNSLEKVLYLDCISVNLAETKEIGFGTEEISCLMTLLSLLDAFVDNKVCMFVLWTIYDRLRKLVSINFAV